MTGTNRRSQRQTHNIIYATYAPQSTKTKFQINLFAKLTTYFVFGLYTESLSAFFFLRLQLLLASQSVSEATICLLGLLSAMYAVAHNTYLQYIQRFENFVFAGEFLATISYIVCNRVCSCGFQFHFRLYFVFVSMPSDRTYMDVGLTG